VITQTIENVPFIDLKAQYNKIADEIDDAIKGVVSQTGFILGPEVKQLEAEFAAYCDVEHAVGVSSGTAALELALHAFGVGPGDEVITAANTFIATAFAITYTGATPVLVDIDPDTYTMDITKFEAAITPKTKAVIPVHLYGQPADMDPLLEIATHHNLIIMEDACQAHGARYKGKRVGSLGHAAAFSFYPAKNLGAFGDAGIVVTNDESIAQTIRTLRDVGQKEKYHHTLKGYNHRLDALQAEVLRVKLKYLDEWNADRRAIAHQYNQHFINSGVIPPLNADYAEHVYHLYVIRVPNRDELREHLTEQKIFTGIHYPIPIHFQPAYKDLEYKFGDFPITEVYADQIISLPMYPELPREWIGYVADTIKSKAG
jgi:dTDP-4-amino-4,6-dideoxygalactose transaminase